MTGEGPLLWLQSWLSFTMFSVQKMVLCASSCMYSLASLRKTEQLVDRLFPLGLGLTLPGIFDILKQACIWMKAEFAVSSSMFMIGYTHLITRYDGMMIYVDVKEDGNGYGIKFCNGVTSPVNYLYIRKDDDKYEMTVDMAAYIRDYR